MVVEKWRDLVTGRRCARLRPDPLWTHIPPRTMPRVFVSYAREDAAKAKAIALALERASFDVWFDERIHSGSEFSREIEQALNDASAVVVLWSRNSVESPWVRDEAEEGRDSGRLVAVLLDSSRPPIGFRQFQTTDLSRWSGRGRPRQIDDIIAAVAAKGAEPPPTRPVTRPNERTRAPWILVGLAVLALAAGALWFGLRSREQAQPPALSVALLPFTADSADPDSRRLAAAARDSIAHTLSQGDFAVRTIDSARPNHEGAGDFLISGRVTNAAGKFVATVQMEETQHHVIVFSHQFQAPRTASADFPELIGAQVAAQLSWTAPLIDMERRHPSDPAIITALLQSSVAGLDAIGSLHDYEISRRLAARAPNSPLAQNSFAINTGFVLDQIPVAERADAVSAARSAMDQTIALAPEYGGAHIPWCLLHSEQRRAECEDQLRSGMRTNPDDSFSNWFLSRLLNDVGRNDEAAELASLSLAHDPYMPYKIGHMLRMLEATGKSANAEELYRKARKWWPDQPQLFWNRVTGKEERGDFEGLEQLQREQGSQFGEQLFVPLGTAVKAKSASDVRALCAKIQSEYPAGIACMLAFAQLGDLDDAFRSADALYPSRRGRTPADEERIWLADPDATPVDFLAGPSAASLRRDRRYLALADRVGLLEYWRKGRLPDFCRPPQPEAICSQLRRR